MRIEVGVDIDTVDKHLSHDRPPHGAHPYTSRSGALEGGQFKEMAMSHVSVAYILRFQMLNFKKECLCILYFPISEVKFNERVSLHLIFPNFRCLI